MAKLTFSGPTREADAESARLPPCCRRSCARAYHPRRENHPSLYRADVVTFDPRADRYQMAVGQACADAGITEAQIDTAVALLTNKAAGLLADTARIDQQPFSSVLEPTWSPFQPPSAWNAIFLAAAALDPMTV